MPSVTPCVTPVLLSVPGCPYLPPLRSSLSRNSLPYKPREVKQISKSNVGDFLKHIETDSGTGRELLGLVLFFEELINKPFK